MKVKYVISFFLTSILLITVFPNSITVSSDQVIPSGFDVKDFFDEVPDYLIDIQSLPIVSTRDSFFLYDNQPEGFGGYYADAEKSPTDADDNLCCWAATAANMLEWTGWGFIYSPVVDFMNNTDDFLYHINQHSTPNGSKIEYALRWWFDGELHWPGENWSEEDVQGGCFWAHAYDYTDYVLWSYDDPNNVQQIDEWLHDGYAVGITIHNRNTGKGGHCITVWGYEYDVLYDPATNPHNYYKGLYATDSDDRKHLTNPPDLLKYVKLEYNTSGDFWQFGSYKIDGVTALKPFPGELRPIANAGGIHFKNGDTDITLDASGSVDYSSPPQTLRFRWDFTNDGSWDTDWLESPTINHVYEGTWEGNVKLEVWDGRLRDVDFGYIKEMDIQPSLVDSVTFPEELYILPLTHVIEFRGLYFEPVMQELYSYEWDFGDGTIVYQPRVLHNYQLPGTYPVTLTLSFGGQVIGSDTFILTVFSAQDLTQLINDNIQALDSSAFLKNPNQRKNALEGMLIDDEDSVFNLIDEGMYTNATEKLEMIRAFMDGDSSPKDWIVDAESRQKLCDMIYDLVDFLEIM